MATDLRVLISTIHLTADLERMGDLAHHVAEVVRLRYPEVAIPPEARETFVRMGEVAGTLVGEAIDAIRDRDVYLAHAVEVEDDSMDALRRELFNIVLTPSWTHSIAAAVDVAQLGRYYERYADHAVSVARRVVFIATGQLPHPSTLHVAERN